RGSNRKHKLHVGTGVAYTDQRNIQSDASSGRTKCDGHTGVR
ncbi:putative gp5 C-terminal domain protein, partial [Vibrio parahaemolyticus 3256]